MVWDEFDFEFSRRALPALATPGRWRERTRAVLEAGLGFLAEDDARARMYVSEAVFAGDALRERRQAAMRRLIALMLLYEHV